MADNIDVTPGTGKTIAGDEIAGVLFQRIKLTMGADGVNENDVGSTNPLPVSEYKAATGTAANVTGIATSGTVLAANTARLGATIYNDSTAILYLLCSATGSASTTAFTVKMQPDAYYEVPARYTGIIKGIWASATGFARVTEFT